MVDRGTRFTVSVSELNETDVQVVEGAADTHRYPHHAPSTTTRRRSRISRW
ncbi:MAG: hypothetical protein R3C12_04465 [Planctomycetaceae bacterium]